MTAPELNPPQPYAKAPRQFSLQRVDMVTLHHVHTAAGDMLLVWVGRQPVGGWCYMIPVLRVTGRGYRYGEMALDAARNLLDADVWERDHKWTPPRAPWWARWRFARRWSGGHWERWVVGEYHREVWYKTGTCVVDHGQEPDPHALALEACEDWPRRKRLVAAA